MEELLNKIKDLEFELDFYKSRINLINKVQKYMRDPERTMICDIVANNSLLPDPNSERYGLDLRTVLKLSQRNHTNPHDPV